MGVLWVSMHQINKNTIYRRLCNHFSIHEIKGKLRESNRNFSSGTNWRGSRCDGRVTGAADAAQERDLD